MTESLLVRIPEVGIDYAEWTVLDDNGKIAGDIIASTLGKVAERALGRPVTIVSAGEDVVLMKAEVPAGSLFQAKKAIPFALEENLASDVDELHFAVGKQTDAQHYPVAIISRQQMDALKRQCDEAGLHPTKLVPEQLAVPLQEDEEMPWCAVLSNGRTILRQRDFAGFAVDTENFSPMLDRALREAHENAPKNLKLFNVGETPEPPLAMATESVSYSNILEVFALGIGSPSINLLQGDYSRRQQYGKLWRPWKVSAILLGLLLLTAWVSSLVEYVQLGQRTTMLDQQIEQTLKQAFPDVERIVNPRAQMKSRMAKLGKGSNSFIATVGEIARAVSADNNVSLRSINYREGRVDIELDAPRLELFDAIKQRIDAGGRLTASIQSANKDKDRVRGRIRIQER